MAGERRETSDLPTRWQGVVFGFNDGNRDVGLVVEDVVGPLLLAAGDQLATHDDTALGEADLFPHLGGKVPPGLYQRRRDELATDVAFGEGPFIHVDRMQGQ